MAKVYLESTDTAFTISNNNTSVYGAAGDQVITIASGVTGVTYDQNTERVVFAGASSAYTYLQSGNQILVYSGGVLVATIPVQGDTNGTQLTFTDGTANAVLTTGVMALGGTTVSSTAAAVVTPTTIDTTVVSGTVTGGTVTGQAFTLTTSATADNLVLTTGNDTVTGAADALMSSDFITDTSTTDSDTLTTTVTSSSVKAHIQNVETLNIDGQYVTTGLDLANVSNTKTVNLNTTLADGTATLTNASTSNAASVVVGANIVTVNVTAVDSGTAGTVKINTGSATSTTLTANTGTDLFEATTTGNVTVTGGGAADTVTLNLSDAATKITGGASLGNMVINQTGVDGAITIDTALTNTVTALPTSKTIVNSDKNVTLKADNAKITDTAITTTGAGTVTVQITNDASAIDLADVQADVIDLTKATTASTVVTHASSKVKLSEDMGSGTAMIFNQSYAAGIPTIAAGEGTLVMEVAKTQTGTSIATGAAVGTLLLSAGVDSTASTCAKITMADLQLGANTNSAVLTGANNLVLTKLTMDATTKDTVTASSMTGNLTISETVGTGDATISLGQGNDSIGATAVGIAKFTVNGGAGNDTIAIAAAKLDSEVYGDAGNDTITGGALGSKLYGGEGDDTINNKLTYTSGDTTVDGGAGSDTINMLTAAGKNTVTLGDGADQLRLTANAAQASTHTVKVTDFVKGTDTLVLTGTSDAGVNLTSVTSSTGVYGFTGAAGDYVVTLTGNTATDMSDSAQLGVNGSGTSYTNSTYVTGQTARDTAATANAFTAFADSTVVGGSKADTINVATDAKATITLGAGADKFIVQAGTGSNETGTSTITDFNTAEDVIILAGTAGVAIDITATQTAGQIDFGADVFKTTLTNVTATDVKSFVQLGTADILFTAKGDATTKGGDLVDYITTANNGTGTTVVQAGKGADVIVMGTAAKIETLTIASGESTTTAYDKVFGFKTIVTDGDKLDIYATGASVNIATLIGTTAVDGITGATVANGVITSWTGIDSIVNASTLSKALAFLATNIGGTDTVAFHYAQDLNSNCDTADTNETSTFVFQNGTTDTVVELVGVTAAGTIALGKTGTPVANTIEIA